MNILCIMPNVNGIQEIINDIQDQVNENVELRTNYMQAKNAVKQYDVIIVHQLVTPASALEAKDFDEITDLNPNAMLIPLLQAEKGDDVLKKLFALGIYEALFLDDSDADSIVSKLRKKRSRSDAKNYYGITASDFNEIDDSILSDAKLKRTIEFFRTSKNNIDEVFKNTADTLNKRQMLYLVENLPEDVKEVLEQNELFQSFEKTLKRHDSKESKTIIIEKTRTEIQEVEKTEIVKSNTMRRKLFTVVGNSEFCAEMAYVNAKHSSEDVLVIDLDVFTPEIHNIYGMKETVNSGISVKDKYTISSFTQAYEVATTLQLNYDILRGIAVKYKLDNLHVLTGNEVIQKGESYNVKPLQHILEVSLNTYSVVYVNIPLDVYKALNLYMLVNPKSTLLIPFNGGAIDLFNKKKIMKYVGESNQLTLKNIKYVAYEYNSSIHTSETELKNLTDGQYIGSIQHDTHRIKARNDLHDAYVHKMSRKVEDEYRKILTRLGISMRVKLSERVGRLFGRN